MIKIILAVLIISIYGCSSSENKTGSENEQNTEKESPAKADLKTIQLADLNGDPISLTDHRGKIVFLNFWATWCKPCIHEMPSIVRLMEKVKDQEVVFLAASDESREKIEKFMDKYDFPFKFIRVLDDYAGLEIWALPTTIIYDRDGNVVLNESGAREWDAEDIVDKISDL